MSRQEKKSPELIETPRRKARREAEQRRKRILVGGCSGIFIILALLAAGIVPLFRPASSEHRPIEVRVPSRIGVSGIGGILQEKGVIRSAFAFTWYARWNGASSKLKPGRYLFSGDMSLDQIVQQLEAGGEDLFEGRIKVVIPEGFTLQQIAQTLEADGVVKAKTFLRYATDPYTIERLHVDFPVPKRTVEGYLFPDTYGFKPHAAPIGILEIMLTNFSMRFVRPYQQEIASSGHSLHEIVTMASLIEREAKAPEDRPRIAGVIDNRLARNMRLEIDATVLYALGHHKDRLYYKDLAVRSPYNTYRHKGLPPGPIASPGLASLLAVLHPEKSDYLYYVARPNGTHTFSRTPAEHEAAKRQARSEWDKQERAAEAQHGG